MRTWSCLAASAVALAAAAAGCGGGQTSQPAATEPSGGEPPAQAATEAAGPPASAPPETAPGTDAETDAASPYGGTAEEEQPTTGGESSEELTPEEATWLAGARIEEVLAAYVARDSDLEGNLGESIDVELTQDLLAAQVTSGDLSFVVPLTADSCSAELESAGTPPTPRLEEIYRTARSACRQLERALQSMGILYEQGEVARTPDYSAVLAAMRRATRLAAEATRVLDELGAP